MINKIQTTGYFKAQIFNRGQEIAMNTEIVIYVPRA